MSSHNVRFSMFLSMVLRHEPETIGIALDAQGWVDVEELISKSSAAGTPFTRQELQRVVDKSDKKRFTLSEDGCRIRAAQGHSVSVELGLLPQKPPATLFHGTATRFLASIMAEGLTPQSRQQVHLSADAVTARRVGKRHGKPAILQVYAQGMHARGHAFFIADNGVWLTDRVPPEFLRPIAISDF